MISIPPLERSRPDLSAARRENARRHHVAEADRAADGDDAVADTDLVAFAPLDGTETTIAFDLDDSDVRLGVAAKDLGLEFTAIAQLDGHLLGAIHDVVVGQHKARCIDDETGAERAAGRRPLLGSVRELEAE